MHRGGITVRHKPTREAPAEAIAAHSTPPTCTCMHLLLVQLVCTVKVTAEIGKNNEQNQHLVCMLTYTCGIYLSVQSVD